MRAAAILLALAACGGAEPEAQAATAEAAPAPAQTVPPPVPTGYYECYFFGDYGLQNSSMVSLTIHSGTEYEAMEERGRYTAEGKALRMETGPLAGRVAEAGESDGKAAIIFRRKPNEVDGRPTIDISDTWCYHEPR